MPFDCCLGGLRLVRRALPLSSLGTAPSTSGSCRHIELGDRCEITLIYAPTQDDAPSAFCKDVAAGFLSYWPSDCRAETGARRVHTLDKLPTVTNAAMRRSLP